MSSLRKSEQANVPDILQGYATQTIPCGQHVPGWRVGLMLIGIGITMPIFMEGVEISQRQGFQDSSITFIFGGFVIGFIAFLTGSVGSQQV